MSSGRSWTSWVILLSSRLSSSVGYKLCTQCIMHLFVLYIEPLRVRLSHVLQGIRVFDQKLTIRAFFDDVTLFLSCDDDVVKAGEVYLDLFCQWTRVRMIKMKTKALGLGNWRHKPQWPLPWLESQSSLFLLGIKFSPSIVETADRVWKDVIFMEFCERMLLVDSLSPRV